MMKINLLDNLLADPLVVAPSAERIQDQWAQMLADKKPKTTRKRKITMCGCGHHPVNPKKDIYKQHNHWMSQQFPKTERGRANLQGVKGLDAPFKKYTPTYDFSGEEFEVTAEEIREFKK